jgi:hypothetical protein
MRQQRVRAFHMTAKRNSHSSLNHHKRIKSRLLPPLNALNETGKLNFSCWVDERLPDLLWLAIIRTTWKQETSLEIFRRFIEAFDYMGDEKTPIPTHSFLGRLSGEEFDLYMRPIISDTEICRALGSLLFLDTLPDLHHWKRHVLVNGDSFNVLANAIFHCLDHQSQESTDIRWLSVMCMIRNQRVIFPDEDKFRARAREYELYPNVGDQRTVRPSIRALEMMFRQQPDEPKATNWPSDFWQHCWRATRCMSGKRISTSHEMVSSEPDPKRLINRIEEIYAAINDHFFLSRENTNLDARHDSTFGIALYTLYLSFECLVTGAHQRAIGQLIVRAIAEATLTLGYLRKVDDPKIWVQYRNYGMGQVKLNFLKLMDQADIPNFVDLDVLEQLISEDFWHEHLEINLGHWAGRDLRKLSEEAGMKDIYDKYYSTTSPFVHGTWSAVRMVAFETCFNPLHRLHRIPSLPIHPFPSSIIDIKKLVNIVLDFVTSLYPEFKLRIREEDMTSKPNGDA